MSFLLSDPVVHAITVLDLRHGLVERPLGGSAEGVDRLVRSGLADRLADVSDLLPVGLLFHPSEGYRPQEKQEQIIADYAIALRRSRSELTDVELEVLQSQYVAPLYATPEENGRRRDTTTSDLDAKNASNLKLLCTILEAVGCVAYPSRWWHRNYGDRYWAMYTRVPHSICGPTIRNTSERE